MHPVGIRILVTGTPGTGKTTLSGYLKKKTGYKVINLSDVIEKKKLYRKACTEYDTLEYSPKKISNYLKRKVSEKTSYIFDTHDPESLSFLSFDVIIVLSADLSVLGERYRKRSYNQKKTEENIQVEIMEVVYNEAVEHLCKNDEEADEIIRICTTKEKDPKTLEEIYEEIKETEKWKKVFPKRKMIKEKSEE